MLVGLLTTPHRAAPLDLVAGHRVTACRSSPARISRDRHPLAILAADGESGGIAGSGRSCGSCSDCDADCPDARCRAPLVGPAASEGKPCGHGDGGQGLRGRGWRCARQAERAMRRARCVVHPARTRGAFTAAIRRRERPNRDGAGGTSGPAALAPAARSTAKSRFLRAGTKAAVHRRGRTNRRHTGRIGEALTVPTDCAATCVGGVPRKRSESRGIARGVGARACEVIISGRFAPHRPLFETSFAGGVRRSTPAATRSRDRVGGHAGRTGRGADR